MPLHRSPWRCRGASRDVNARNPMLREFGGPYVCTEGDLPARASAVRAERQMDRHDVLNRRGQPDSTGTVRAQVMEEL
jgi:hypothetical protein